MSERRRRRGGSRARGAVGQNGLIHDPIIHGSRDKPHLHPCHIRGLLPKVWFLGFSVPTRLRATELPSYRARRCRKRHSFKHLARSSRSNTKPQRLGKPKHCGSAMRSKSGAIYVGRAPSQMRSKSGEPDDDFRSYFRRSPEHERPKPFLYSLPSEST